VSDIPFWSELETRAPPLHGRQSNGVTAVLFVLFEASSIVLFVTALRFALGRAIASAPNKRGRWRGGAGRLSWAAFETPCLGRAIDRHEDAANEYGRPTTAGRTALRTGFSWRATLALFVVQATSLAPTALVPRPLVLSLWATARLRRVIGQETAQRWRLRHPYMALSCTQQPPGVAVLSVVPLKGVL